MPVKGLTDRDQYLPRIGKVHLGILESKGDKRSFPKQTPYFVVRADGTTTEEAAAGFKDVYGDQPKELDIMFPVDAVDSVADAFHRAYSSAYGLICKGDGENARAKWDYGKDGDRPADVEGSVHSAPTAGTWVRGTADRKWEFLNIPCAGSECPMQQTNPSRCKPVMNLQFLLPSVPGLGIWQCDTSSWNSITKVRESLNLLQRITGGTIRGLPLQLRLVPLEVSPLGGTKKTVYVLEIVLPQKRLADIAATARALPAAGLLPPPVDESEMPDDMVQGDGPALEGEILDADQPVLRLVEPQSGEIIEDVGIARPEQPCHGCGELIDPDNEFSVREHAVCVNKETPREVAERPTVAVPEGIKSVGDLLTHCYREWGVQAADVYKMLGVKDAAGITDVALAYAQVTREMLLKAPR